MFYYDLFYQQFSKKEARTGRITWIHLDICKLYVSLDHLQVFFDVHLKVYTYFKYVIISPSPCEVGAILNPDISNGRGSTWNYKKYWFKGQSSCGHTHKYYCCSYLLIALKAIYVLK